MPHPLLPPCQPCDTHPHLHFFIYFSISGRGESLLFLAPTSSKLLQATPQRSSPCREVLAGLQGNRLHHFSLRQGQGGKKPNNQKPKNLPSPQGGHYHFVVDNNLSPGTLLFSTFTKAWKQGLDFFSISSLDQYRARLHPVVGTEDR